MPKSDTWPPFAFTSSSDWGRCYTSFLQAIYERRGSLSSYIHYKAILRDFLTQPAKIPDAYSRFDVEQYLHSPGKANGHVGQPVKFGTQNNRLACLRAFYKYAAEWPVVDAQGASQPLLQRLPPTAGIRFVRREKPPYRSLSEEQVRRFFGAIDKNTISGLKWYAIFLCYLILARRRAEIANLRWGDIEPALIVEPGGLRRPGYIYHWRGKGKLREDDSYEMPRVVHDAIVAYVEASGRLATIQPGDPIFITEASYHGQKGYDPQRPLHPQTIWANCKRIAREAGLDPTQVTVHSFRHASAQARYLAGQNIYEISALLRHASLDTTAIYLSELTGTADTGYRLIQKRFENL